MSRENGYYWVKPAKLSYKDQSVIATFENGMFWIHGTGEAYVEESMKEIDECRIIQNSKHYFVIKRFNSGTSEDTTNIIGLTTDEEYAKSMQSVFCTYEEVQLIPKAKVISVSKVKDQINKAQLTLSELCKNPNTFTMRIPADEERDTDLIIAKALRYASEMEAALLKIIKVNNVECNAIAIKALEEE